MRCLLSAAVAVGWAACAHAQAPGRFDGTWQTVVSCVGARDGAAGYTLRFGSTVTGGVLHGETGVRGQPGSLSLDGTIGPDGSALLLANGMTGNPTYVVGRLTPGTPYSYHLQSHFDADHGTGTRLEVRRCDAVWSR